MQEPETHLVAAFPRLTEASTKDLCWLALNGPATFAQLDEARREEEEDIKYVLFLGLVVLGALAVFAAAAVLNSKLEEWERKRINRERIEANSKKSPEASQAIFPNQLTSANGYHVIHHVLCPAEDLHHFCHVLEHY